MKCESCDIAEFQVEELAGIGQNPYRLCRPCLQRLLTFSLRPLEFFNLASIHGHSYHLHDDFYDYDTGEAMQPKAEVFEAGNFPFPELAKIKDDLQTLVNYACVQYPIPDTIIDFLKLHDKSAISNYLIQKTKYNRAINYQTYEIAAKVLASAAKDWITIEWANRKNNEVLIFAEAICKCIPFIEGFHMLAAEIEATDEKYLTTNNFALIYFQSPKTLDWIEKVSNRITNVSTSWGTLAAASQFSWDRAEKWLAIGRPLSLIALDALVICTTIGSRQHQAPWFRTHPSSLVNSGTPPDIANRITAYLEKDKMPRTKNAIGQIIQNLFATTSE